MTGRVAAGRDPLIQKLRLMDESQTKGFMQELEGIDKPVILGFLNQHGYNIAQHQSRVFNAFMRVNYLLRDGIGIKLACRFNGVEPRANLNGSDFIPALVSHLAEASHGRYQFFAMGTQEPWLSRGSHRLFGDEPFHAIDGFRPAEEYVDFVRTHHQPGHLAVVVLAMGMPKQEEVALRLQQGLECPALMICGGAILDFAAQRFPRAPLAFRKLGMEWLFRLLMEPRRLFHRYVIGIPLFFTHVWRNGRLARRQAPAPVHAAMPVPRPTPAKKDPESLEAERSLSS